MANYFLRKLQPVSALVIVFSASACGETTSPVVLATDAVASVTIVEDTTVATTINVVERDILAMRFKFTVRITNAGTTPFRFELCGSQVEQKIATEWIESWSPVCALEGSAPNDPILAGQTATRTIDVAAAFHGPMSPAWRTPVPPADIRFSAAVIPVGYSGNIPRVASNSVRLVLAP